MSELIRFRFVRPGFPGARGLAALALVLALSLAGQGCSDDSTGGALVDPCLDFTTAAAPASGDVTTRLGDESTCMVAELEIVATDVDDVWALVTTVTYDTAVAAYVGYDKDDSVLGLDGTAVTAVIEPTASGELTVGVSRVAALEGTDIDQTGVLLKLLFALNSTVADTGSFTLGEGELCLQRVDPVAPGEPPVQPEVIPNVDCIGGTFVVQ